LPTQFEEILLKQYIAISSMNKDLNKLDKDIELLSILTGLSTEDIVDINIDTVKYMFKSLEFLFEQKEHTLIEKIKLDGQWYGLNPDMKNITFGEYIDLETFSDLEKKQDSLHILMAILYRPITTPKKRKNLVSFLNSYIYNKDDTYSVEKYDPDTVEERSKVFLEHMTIDVTLGALFFFILLKVIYTENTQHYLSKKKMKARMMTMIKELKINYKTNGDG